jgi:spermidine/putrescine transport system substrate-binding protein
MDRFSAYAVPYIWGTFGIMYDTTYFTAEEAEKFNSWTSIFDTTNAKLTADGGKTYMKKQVRDGYTATMLAAWADKLKEASNDFDDYSTPEYTKLLNEIFTVFDQAKLSEAQALLLAQKNGGLIKKYEGDEGKYEMADGTSAAGKAGLFWSCDAGYVMADGEDEVTGDLIPGNKNLGYIVPKEGSNLWVDGWVIPKNAGNPAAANAFIKFTVQKEISILNSEYAGAPSANYEAFNELKTQYEEDEEFFADAPAGFKEMYIEARFPSQKTLERCAIMADFGTMYDAYYEMYKNLMNA